MNYRTIVADPPWQVQAGPRSLHDPREKSRPLPYGTMTLAEIQALPVRDWADTDAHLYVWTINAYVEQTYSVARAWGFEPSTLLVWAKAPKGRGLGGTFSTATEYVLFARRGSLAATGRVDRNWWQWEARAALREARRLPRRWSSRSRRGRTWRCSPVAPASVGTTGATKASGQQR